MRVDKAFLDASLHCILPVKPTFSKNENSLQQSSERHMTSFIYNAMLAGKAAAKPLFALMAASKRETLFWGNSGSVCQDWELGTGGSRLDQVWKMIW